MIITEATEHDEQVALADELLEKEDYTGAAKEAGKVIDQLEPNIPALAQAALTQGRALMTKAMEEMAKTGELPSKELFDKVYNVYELAKKLDPDNTDAKFETNKLLDFLREIPPPMPPKEVESADYDVVVVGAGAAGVGTALMLTKTFNIDKSRVLMIERGEEVGESFRRWPAEMRFISPSFNQQGWTNSFDLNAIASGTSPAYSIHAEHPSGNEYAAYLTAIAKTNELNIRKETEVVSIRDIKKSKELPLFSIETRSSKKEDSSAAVDPQVQSMTARYIVWAAGEFQYPFSPEKEPEKENEEEKKSDGEDMEGVEEEEEDKGIEGLELCMHNSSVRSWAKVPGDDFVIIGGYESGVDACVNLSRAGKRCKVLASTPCWSIKTEDPSAELAPYTAARLRDVLAPTFSPNPKLFAPVRVTRVEKAKEGGFNVIAEWKGAEEAPHAPLRELVNEVPTEEPSAEGSSLVIHTPQAPVLCTGFEGSVAAAASHLFEFAGKDDKKKGCLDGAPLLTKVDESTKVPGVFLVGPTVSHGSHSFCFVYKFRQRFGVVANAIATGLGIDTRAAVSECRKTNMFLDDLSCCQDTCGDVC